MSLFVWPESNREFVAGVVPPEDIDSAWYFVFCRGEILLRLDADEQFMPLTHQDWPLLEGHDHVSHYMGRLGDKHCFAVEMSTIEEETAPLSGLFGRTDNLMFSMVGRAVQIVDWYRAHKYCGRCGAPNLTHDRDRAMICERCGIHAYPRLSPSIIVLIHRDDQVLLARNRRFPEGRYSTLAGFVEPGESVEETLIREVNEEVGVDVGHLAYQGSQSWPFPNSLMLGFHAEYAGGDIVCQDDEIADAAWFSLEELPNIPGRYAISRWLIDGYLSTKGVVI